MPTATTTPTAQTTRERYFTPAEVEVHGSAGDCWVSLLGKVLDVTKLIQENKGEASRLIMFILSLP